jgi:NADP-dependent 3-hydroxy acid dehydrogenase YdfG
MDVREMPQQRVAGVTGATSGIGEATVARLVEAGMRVIANGRRQEKLEALEAQLHGAPGRMRSVPGDIRDAGIINNMFRTSRESFGVEPSVMVLSAGGGQPGTLLTSDAGRWESLFETNVLALMSQMREISLLWKKGAAREAGITVCDLVVIGSTIGRSVSAFNPVYGATKFALHSLVEALRQELCQEGIRVSLIEPGFVKSGFQESSGYDMNWFGQVERDLGPLLSPQDIARIVEFIIGSPPHVHIDDVRVRPIRQKV